MVDTTYFMTKVLEIGNLGKSLKTTGCDDSDDFRAMLDKNTQKAEQDKTKTDTNTNTNKTDSKPKTEQAEGKEETKAPEMQEQEDGVLKEDAALQNMVQQCAMANEQKMTLNWAETPVQTEEGAAQAVTEIAGEQTEATQQNVQSQQNTQLSAQTQSEVPKAVQDGVKQEQAAQLQENQPKQERQADTTQQFAVKTEGKDVQVTVQKGAEGQVADDGGQTDLPEQKTTDMADAAALQKAAPGEENLVQVKVGETVDISEPKAAEQLADSILVKAQENTNEYEMQLNPQELGKIKIKLLIADGKVHVSMLCENQKAADLLGLTGDRLRSILEERTGSEVYVEVQKEDATPYHEQEQEKEQNGRGYENSRKKEDKDGDAADFMQQLRLGLLDLQ